MSTDVTEEEDVESRSSPQHHTKVGAIDCGISPTSPASCAADGSLEENLRHQYHGEAVNSSELRRSDSLDLESGNLSRHNSVGSKVDAIDCGISPTSPASCAADGSLEENLRHQYHGEAINSSELRRSDSLDLESGNLSRHSSVGSKDAPWSVILPLAFQSIGVVFGDIGTSPLYVFPSTFPNGIHHEDDVLGALSLILYTLTLILVIKYMFIVLQANDNGEGGTFALYSLICQHAKVGLIPNEEAEDRDHSTFPIELRNNRKQWASKLQLKLEKNQFAKLLLLFAAMLGTSMVIGDGILTPCISVLSAVGGIKQVATSMNQDTVVWISVGIIIFLFIIQRFGTSRVSYCFAPILCIWFFLIAGIGLANIIKFDWTVIKSVNPLYIFHYFKRNKKDAWISLGGVILCTTGSEALYADLGHFTIRSIQLSTCIVVYPALLLAYMGQAAFLMVYPKDAANAFYKSVPGCLYWPVFVVAVLAATIASQALISGVFSIIHQSQVLKCFPPLQVVHTSEKHEGQVYIPVVNYLLMVACILLTLVFRSTVNIGNAFGIAVVFVMILTSMFLILVMVLIWRTHLVLILGYVVVIVSTELLYMSSVLYKFNDGGYLPLALALGIMIIMYSWNSVSRRKYLYDQQHRIKSEEVEAIVAGKDLCRVPGFGIFYSDLVREIPLVFKHYLENILGIHTVLVFVSVESLHVSKVPTEESFKFCRIQAGGQLLMFHCTVRYGYIDVVIKEEEPFERILYERLKEFINVDQTSEDCVNREVEVVDQAWRAGVCHLVGESEVVAAQGAGLLKKLLVNYAYSFLRRNSREFEFEKALGIHKSRLLKLRMTCEL